MAQQNAIIVTNQKNVQEMVPFEDILGGKTLGGGDIGHKTVLQ